MTHEHQTPTARGGKHSAISEAETVAGDNGVDIQALLAWLQRNQVVLGGIVLIAAQLAWKAQILSHLYFTQDDFYNLDVAVRSPFNWHYLTFVGAGHLMIGPRAVMWMLARISLYDWRLAASVT